MKKTRHKLFIGLFSLTLLASCGGGNGGSGGGGNAGGGATKKSFKTIYNELVADNSVAKYVLTIGSDGSYITFDSNPFDVEGGTTSYLDICHSCTTKCGFSESTWQLMLQTRALDGMQTDSSNGVKARWTYHPNKGLVCTFSS